MSFGRRTGCWTVRDGRILPRRCQPLVFSTLGQILWDTLESHQLISNETHVEVQIQIVTGSRRGFFICWDMC